MVQVAQTESDDIDVAVPGSPCGFACECPYQWPQTTLLTSLWLFRCHNISTCLARLEDGVHQRQANCVYATIALSPRLFSSSFRTRRTCTARWLALVQQALHAAAWVILPLQVLQDNHRTRQWMIKTRITSTGRTSSNSCQRGEGKGVRISPFGGTAT